MQIAHTNTALHRYTHIPNHTNTLEHSHTETLSHKNTPSDTRSDSKTLLTLLNTLYKHTNPLNYDIN